MQDLCKQLRKEREDLIKYIRKEEGMVRTYHQIKDLLTKLRADVEESGSSAKLGITGCEIAAVIKLMCDKFNDIAELFLLGEEKVAAEGMKEVYDYLKADSTAMDFANKVGTKKVDAKSTYDFAVNTALPFVTEFASKKVAKKISKVNPITGIISSIWDIQENLKTVVEVDEARQGVIEDLRRNLDNLDKQIKKNDANLGTAAQRAQRAQAQLLLSDKYLRENCSGMIFSSMQLH